MLSCVRHFAPLACGNDLRRTIKLGEGQISGPETIIFDQQDNMYALTDTGDVVRINQDAVGEMSMSFYAHVGGRPLGEAFAPRRAISTWQKLLKVCYA
jgi:ribose transport system permease protein